ncbi:MAG TPA: glycoside hydrolase family 57 protein [Candidatus Dormibacteraeota bacterium]|jgi:alpha-amylase/alpha-mannosidase (GH57 family)|nr:glycoside hydrolase family 57 protein [Candidatus Dormibacteraeota bacterium]
MPPLHVAIVWHMHQPYYRDDRSGRFVLPWARLRGSKDYGRMTKLAMRHPDLRITINYVPSLFEQLDAYARGHGEDPHRELCLRRADQLTVADRRFLVGLTRGTGFAYKVRLFAPFMELLARLREGDLEHAADSLAVDDLRDLQAWWLLAWIDPEDIAADPDLLRLAEQGRGFAEPDKALIDERQMGLLRQVIPLYREAVAAGQVEAMTSPAYHPILPLLIDPEAARVAIPDLPLPSRPMNRRDDAVEQIRVGLKTFARHAGVLPRGMWPSECAVSPDAVKLIGASGLQWAISDEHVLERSLSEPVRGDVASSTRLYSPWRDASGVTMVFRDADLSNRIGFIYGGMPTGDAVDDLVWRLEYVASQQPEDRAWLVVLALDGENCWEHYEEDGDPFLDRLYARLTSNPRLRTTHVGTFLDEHPETVQTLPKLWSGSWIDASFTTWIGDPQHNRAWDLLAAARDALETAGGPQHHPAAYRELLVAEGSDWFWWFGRHHDSGIDAAWDALYRTHLRNAYELLSLPVPAEVDRPILEGVVAGADRPPQRSITPRPGAGDEAEWAAAGVAEVGRALGTMHPPSSSVGAVRYGIGAGRLAVRFGDEAPRFSRAELDLWVSPAGAQASGGEAEPRARVVVERTGDDYGVSVVGGDGAAGPAPEVGMGPALEVTVPLGVVGASAGDEVRLRVVLDEEGRGRESVPASGALTLTVPASE